MFSNGQNLKHVDMTCSFLEPLIFFWLNIVDWSCLEFISHIIKEILYVDPNSKENQSWNKKRHIFSLVSDTDVEKSLFF